jgi:hypothetical protein
MKENIIKHLYYLLLWSQMVVSLYASHHTWLPSNKVVDKGMLYALHHTWSSILATIR